jgi:hypothetical protein
MEIQSISVQSIPATTLKDRSTPSVNLRILILFSSLIIIAFQISLSFAMQRFQTRKPDFASLYQAGRKIDHERFPFLVSRFPALNSSQYSVELNAHEFPADTMHPPYELVLYATLALLKFRTAYLVWWACNLGLLLLATFVLWPHVSGLQGGYPYLLILIATFFPVLVALVQGQNSILLLALLALSYNSFENQNEFRAGFILSMGMFKFLLILPMALWLLLEKRWRSLFGFITGCLCLLLTAIWLIGISGIEAYIRTLTGFGKKAPEQPSSQSIMPNLRGLFHAIGSPIAPEIVLMALTLIASIALLIWVDSRLRKYSNDLGVRFSMQVLLTALISYHFYPHDGAILVLPIMLLLDRALQGTDRRFRLSIIGCAACTYLVPLAGGLSWGMPVVAASSLALLILARKWSLSTTALGAVH